MTSEVWGGLERDGQVRAVTNLREVVVGLTEEEREVVTNVGMIEDVKTS